MYACPVLHCSTLPKTSRLSLSALKWLVGLRDGLSRFAMANRPSLVVFFHSFCQTLAVLAFSLRLAFERVVKKGS